MDQEVALKPAMDTGIPREVTARILDDTTDYIDGLLKDLKFRDYEIVLRKYIPTQKYDTFRKFFDLWFVIGGVNRSVLQFNGENMKKLIADVHFLIDNIALRDISIKGSNTSIESGADTDGEESPISEKIITEAPDVSVLSTDHHVANINYLRIKKLNKIKHNIIAKDSVVTELKKAEESQKKDQNKRKAILPPTKVPDVLKFLKLGNNEGPILLQISKEKFLTDVNWNHVVVEVAAGFDTGTNIITGNAQPVRDESLFNEIFSNYIVNWYNFISSKIFIVYIY